MTGTTLSLSEQGLEMAQNALVETGWTQAILASKTFTDSETNSTVPISTKTVQNFLSRKDMSIKVFHAICDTLKIDWEVASGRKSVTESSQTAASESGTASNTNSNDSTVTQNIGPNNSGNVVAIINGNVTFGGNS